MRTLLATLSLATSLTACGGDAAPDVDATPRPPDGPPASALGDVCATATPADCPTDFTCEVRGAIGGATDRGYCSPVCGGDGDCTDGYAGPGDPTCLGSACIIVCDADCPAGLTCLPTGGPTSICAVAE